MKLLRSDDADDRFHCCFFFCVVVQLGETGTILCKPRERRSETLWSRTRQILEEVLFNILSEPGDNDLNNADVTL